MLLSFTTTHQQLPIFFSIAFRAFLLSPVNCQTLKIWKRRYYIRLSDVWLRSYSRMSVMAAILDFLVMLYLQNCVMAVLHYRKTLNTCYMFYFWPYFHNINDINSSPLPFILHQWRPFSKWPPQPNVPLDLRQTSRLLQVRSRAIQPTLSAFPPPWVQQGLYLADGLNFSVTST